MPRTRCHRVYKSSDPGHLLPQTIFSRWIKKYDYILFVSIIADQLQSGLRIGKKILILRRIIYFERSKKAISLEDEYLPGVYEKRSMMNMFAKRGAAQDRLNSILAKYKSDPNCKFLISGNKVWYLRLLQWKRQKWPVLLAVLSDPIYKLNGMFTYFHARAWKSIM